MSGIYFVDDREESGTIFVKKDDGELIYGDEHDYGLLCVVDGMWFFEPIATHGLLDAVDLGAIAAQLIELNLGHVFAGSIIPVGFVFTVFDDETASNKSTHLTFGNGCVSELSMNAACEIEQCVCDFFDVE